MAHGYLSVQDTRGEGHLQTIADVLKGLLKRGKENGAPPDKGGALVLQKKGDLAEVYKKPDPADDKGGALVKKGAASLVGAFSQMVKSGGGAVAKASGQPALPPGGPRLPGGAEASGGGGGSKGGSFVDMGGAVSRPLNTDNFFASAVNMGVDAETGDYLSKEERVARFKAGRVPSARAQAMGGGDNGSSIVSALANNTAAIVQAINNQTSNDTNLKNQEIQASEAALADQKAMLKEQSAEQGLGGKSSAFAGAGSLAQAKGTGGGGGGGGLLGGITNMLGGFKGLKGLKGLGGLGKGLKGLGGLGKGLKGLGGLGKGLGKGLAKGAGKGLMKGGLKMGIKKIPFLGLGAAALFAGQRALAGDFAGAGLELASGGASMIPGLGTAASLGIDAALMARDAGGIPSMSGGGFTSGPKSGYLSMMHGKELTLSGESNGKTIQIGEMLGEGMLRTQKKRSKDMARVTADGLSEYYDKRNGWEKFIDFLKGLLPWVDNPDFNLLKPGTWFKKNGSRENTPGGGGDGKGNLTASDGTLKGKIRSLESGGDYGSTFKGYLSGFDRKDEDITKMSIKDVVKYQKDYIAHQKRLGIPESQRSAAVGAYQMLYPEVAAKAVGVDLNAKFDQETQDKLAEYYLNIAGQQDYLKGNITAEEYNDRLAGQFASIKKTDGTGVYDNDGVNNAYGTVLEEIKGTTAAKLDKDKKPVVPITKSFLGGRNYGLDTGDSLDVGVDGTNYQVVKTEDGFKVMSGGFFGLGRRELKEIPKGLEDAFIKRYQHRTNLSSTGEGDSSADKIASTSAAVVDADRKSAQGEVVATVVMPETKESESGKGGVEVPADGVSGQGVNSILQPIQLARV